MSILNFLVKFIFILSIILIYIQNINNNYDNDKSHDLLYVKNNLFDFIDKLILFLFFLNIIFIFKIS